MRTVVCLCAALLAVSAAPAAFAQSPPASKLLSLPRKPLSDRTAVTIYQFRSGVAAVNNAAATDIFTTALIRSGQFRVVERAQFNPGVLAEKSLNSGGKTTGDGGAVKLTAAKYIFEGAVTESSVNGDQSTNNFTVGGMAISRGGASGAISIDVRIIDAETGDVLDSVVASEPVMSKKSSLTGVGSLVGALGGFKNLPGGITADAGTTSQHDDSVDTALRAAIEKAVLELIQRM